MKNIILIIVIAILVVVVFYPKPYFSSPGFTTQEGYDEFQLTRERCIGISYLTNRTATMADAPGKSLCFGLLK